MELSNKQIIQISKSISISDIKSYIETHKIDFQKFLEEEEKNK